MDNNILPGHTDDNSAFEGKPMMAVNFYGKAKIRNEREHRKSLESEFIPSLNVEADKIAYEIRREIKENLPAGLDVNLDISFYKGSIRWDGVANVLQVLGSIVGGVDFTKLVIGVIRFSINKVLRSRIGSRYPVKSITTTVRKKRIKDLIHPVTRFLWWCSGATKDILRDSLTEESKYVGIGGVILTTGVLACMSGGWAMYTVFETSSNAILAGFLFAPLWGLIIFNLDRYIVSSMKKEKDKSRLRAVYREMGPAVPRFIFAVLLAVTISVPLELKIFQTEILSQVEFNKSGLMTKKNEQLGNQYSPRVKELKDRRQHLEDEIKGKEEQINNLRDAYYHEMDATGGTRRYGKGPVAEAKKKEFENVQENRREEIGQVSKQLDEVQTEEKQIDKDKATAAANYEKTLGKGILARIKALSDLSNDRSMWLATWFILLLLIFLEIAPVLVKLLARFGPYDAKLDLREEADIESAGFKKTSVVRIAEEHYSNLTDAEIEVERMFFDSSVDIRKDEVKEEFQRWLQGRSIGQAPSFEEFSQSVKNNLYLNRN